MIELIKLWFKRAVPNLTEKNQAVQLGVHAEEFAEMLVQIVSPVADDTVEHVDQFADFYKSYADNVNIHNRELLLDSLCDQIVTAVGVAHMFGLDIEGALQEVNRSNWSKFDSDGQPLFDKKGKIKKGPNYTPPNLTKFL